MIDQPQKSKVGGARRDIDWEALDTSALSVDDRNKVGRVWAHRREQEHLAVGAFALLTHELAQEGCADVVLALVARAASDEVRHADICRRVAIAHLGEDGVAKAVRGTPDVPPHVGLSGRDRVLLHMVEMCCLSETVTGVYFTEMAVRATHPIAHEIVSSLLEDEIDHGRVGWAYLASKRGELAVLAGHLPALLERTFGPYLGSDPSAREADRPALEAFGYLGSDYGREVYRRTLREVVMPGFEEVGVDVGAATAFVRERGWM